MLASCQCADLPFSFCHPPARCEHTAGRSGAAWPSAIAVVVASRPGHLVGEGAAQPGETRGLWPPEPCWLSAYMVSPSNIGTCLLVHGRRFAPAQERLLKPDLEAIAML